MIVGPRCVWLTLAISLSITYHKHECFEAPIPFPFSQLLLSKANNLHWLQQHWRQLEKQFNHSHVSLMSISEHLYLLITHMRWWNVYSVFANREKGGERRGVSDWNCLPWLNPLKAVSHQAGLFFIFLSIHLSIYPFIHYSHMLEAICK